VPAQPAPVRVPEEQRLILTGISWAGYQAIGTIQAERRVRLTYDRGVLEIMTLSRRHERSKTLLARFVEALTEEMDIDLASGGGITFAREELERGFESDESFWIANEAAVGGKEELDLTKDPPPDLTLEVEVSRSALNRMHLFASFGIPEVWRWDGAALHVCLLGADGEYAERERSKAFPFLPLAEVVRFLQRAAEMSETKLLREFRQWVREQMARGWGTSAEGQSGATAGG
jgi:Uma2 family endonuclease